MSNPFNKITALLLVLLLSLVMSCGKNDEGTLPEAPTITIISDQLSIDSVYQSTANEQITFSITVNAPGGFNNSSTKLLINDVELSSIEEKNTTGTTKLVHSSANPINFITTEDHVGDVITVEIIVIDDNDLSATLSVSFTVFSALANIFTDIILADSIGNLLQTSFYSTNKNVVYAPDFVNNSINAVYNDIDFGYLYDENTDETTIASPQGFTTNSDYSPQVVAWNVKNSTTLLTTTLTTTAFNSIVTWADIESAYANGSEAAELKTNLQVGDVIAFQTNTTKTISPSKKGLILIKTINGTDNAGDNIELVVVVQD